MEEFENEEFKEKDAQVNLEFEKLDEKYPDILPPDDKFIYHLFVHWNTGKWNIIDAENIPEEIVEEMKNIFLKHFGDNS